MDIKRNGILIFRELYTKNTKNDFGAVFNVDVVE